MIVRRRVLWFVLATTAVGATAGLLVARDAGTEGPAWQAALAQRIAEHPGDAGVCVVHVESQTRFAHRDRKSVV